MRFRNIQSKIKNNGIKTLYDFSVKDAENNIVNLSQYKENKVVLVVNVASYWGLTNRNYAELQYLYNKYKTSGLIILGFPSNQFANQEPKSNQEIQKFIKNKNVTFPVFAKIDVNGNKEDPLYKFLKNKKSSLLGKTIKWNFTKFLCVDGIPLNRYEPTENPKSFENKIVEYLNQNDDI